MVELPELLGRQSCRSSCVSYLPSESRRLSDLPDSVWVPIWVPLRTQCVQAVNYLCKRELLFHYFYLFMVSHCRALFSCKTDSFFFARLSIAFRTGFLRGTPFRKTRANSRCSHRYHRTLLALGPTLGNETSSHSGPCLRAEAPCPLSSRGRTARLQSCRACSRSDFRAPCLGASLCLS